VDSGSVLEMMASVAFVDTTVKAQTSGPWVAHSAQYVAEVVQGGSMLGQTAVSYLAAVEVPAEGLAKQLEGQRRSVESFVPFSLLLTACIWWLVRHHSQRLD
jgi:hypothetical protein